MRIVLYARGRAPDLLGTQAWQARLAAKLFEQVDRTPALPKPVAFAPLAAACKGLLTVSQSPVVQPLNPYGLFLLP